MTVRFLWVTDIPTPYRNHQFERMAAIFPRHEIEFEVAFLAWTDPRRPWKFENKDLHYPWKRYRNPFRFLESRMVHVNPALVGALQRADVVMIGGWGSPSHALAPFLAPSRVVTILGCESHSGSVRRKSTLANAIKRLVIARYDAFLVPGRPSRDLLLSLDPKAAVKPWIQLPNLIDARVFRDRVASVRGEPLRAGPQVWFCPARLAPEKGLHEFLPLVAGLPIEMLIAGDGAMRQELQAMIDRGRLPVRILGQQGEREMVELYAHSDVFVLPSLADPSPLSAVEGAAARLPLLLSRRAGNCDDLVVEGENGWKYDPASPAADRRVLLEKIASTPRSTLTTMGVRSLARYHASFESDLCITRLADFVVRIARS